MYKKNNASSCKGNFCLQIFIPLKKLGHPPAYIHDGLYLLQEETFSIKKNQ